MCIFLIPLSFVIHKMKQKVARMTKLFLKEGGGNEELTAKLFANFMSQRVVQPFFPKDLETSQEKFGENALLTLTEAKKKSIKPGCAADLFRRHILAAGTSGPLTKDSHKVIVHLC